MKKRFAYAIIIASLLLASNAPAAFWEEVKKDTKEAARSVKETSKQLGKDIKKESSKLGREVKKESQKLGKEAAEKSKEAPGFFKKMGQKLKDFGKKIRDRAKKVFKGDDAKDGKQI